MLHYLVHYVLNLELNIKWFNTGLAKLSLDLFEMVLCEYLFSTTRLSAWLISLRFPCRFHRGVRHFSNEILYALPEIKANRSLALKCCKESVVILKVVYSLEIASLKCIYGQRNIWNLSDFYDVILKSRAGFSKWWTPWVSLHTSTAQTTHQTGSRLYAIP